MSESSTIVVRLSGFFQWEDGDTFQITRDNEVYRIVSATPPDDDRMQILTVEPCRGS